MHMNSCKTDNPNSKILAEKEIIVAAEKLIYYSKKPRQRILSLSSPKVQIKSKPSQPNPNKQEKKKQNTKLPNPTKIKPSK